MIMSSDYGDFSYERPVSANVVGLHYCNADALYYMKIDIDELSKDMRWYSTAQFGG